MLFVALATACQYSAIGPSLWPFLSQRFCADRVVLGICTSLFYAAAAVSATVSTILYRRGFFRSLGIASFAIIIVANLFYAQAEQLHSGFENGGPITLGIARFFIGLGSSFLPLTVAWVGEHGDSDEQQVAVSAVSAIFALGFTVGSAVGGLTSVINFSFSVGPFVILINQYTAPAYVAAIIDVFALVVFLWMCRDCEREAAAAAASVHDTDFYSRVDDFDTDDMVDPAALRPAPVHARTLRHGGVHSSADPSHTCEPASSAVSYMQELRPILVPIAVAFVLQMMGRAFNGAHGTIIPLLLQDLGMSVSGLSVVMTCRGVVSLVTMFLLIPIGKKFSMGTVIAVAAVACLIAQVALINPGLYAFETRPIVPGEDGGDCNPSIAAAFAAPTDALAESLLTSGTAVPLTTPSQTASAGAPPVVVVNDIPSFGVYFGTSLILSAMVIGFDTTSVAYISRLAHGTAAQPLIIGVAASISQCVLFATPLVTTTSWGVFVHTRYIVFGALAAMMAVAAACGLYLLIAESTYFPQGRVRNAAALRAAGIHSVSVAPDAATATVSVSCGSLTEVVDLVGGTAANHWHCGEEGRDTDRLEAPLLPQC